MTAENGKDKRERRLLTLDEVAANACELLLTLGSHVSTVLVEGSGKLAIIQLRGVPSTPEERAQHMFIAGFKLARQNEQLREIEQLFHITEGWMTSVSADDTSALPPSEDPKRKEVLLVSQLNIPQRQAGGRVFEMRRDSAGQLGEVVLLDIDIDDQTEAFSPLLGAFAFGFLTGRESSSG